MLEIDEKFKLKTGTKNEYELKFFQYGELVKGLKDIVFNCINHNDTVYSYEQEGKKVIETLAEMFISDIKYLPPEYRANEVIRYYDTSLRERMLNNDYLQKRLICDYISSMMDSYAISTYERLTGNRFMSGHY